MAQSKIGRNQMCPCGSGKKHKFCCLGKDKEVSQSYIPINIYQLIIRKYFKENLLILETQLPYFLNLIYNNLPDVGKPSIDLLKDYLKVTEDLIGQIAKKYSTYEMLFWSRRLGPHNIFETSKLSVILYRDIQTLSIYKYGQVDSYITKDNDSSVSPQSIKMYNSPEYLNNIERINSESLPEEITNLLSDVINIEILSFLFLRATQVYRIVNKGATFEIDKSFKVLGHTSTPELSFLIELYDERLSKANLFSFTGAYVDHKYSDDTSYFCPHFQLNVDHKIRVNIFNPKNEAYAQYFKQPEDIIEIDTNYILSALNLSNIYNFLVLFENEFYIHYKFPVKDFILFLGYLGYKVVIDISKSLEAQITILNRAYIIAEYDLQSFGTEFIGLSPYLNKEIFNEDHDHSIDIVLILNRFLLTSDNSHDIDLWTRGPKRFLYQLSEKYMVIDYSCLTDIITYIVKDITSVDGEIGNRRAISFEEEIEKELNLVFGSESVWVCGGDIVSGMFRKEIDGSFIVEDILFVIEAKAVNVSFGYDKGDKQALEFRINKMKGALQEANEKAEFIKDHFLSINPALPKAVNFICPFVISPNPEYIWSESDDLFFSKELKLPRILTIEDIKAIGKLDLSLLRKSSWVYKLF